LAHLFGEGLRPHEVPCEIPGRARLEEEPVPARLDELGEDASAARDDRHAVGEGFDQGPRHRVVGRGGKYEIGRRLQPCLQIFGIEIGALDQLDPRGGREAKRFAQGRDATLGGEIINENAAGAARDITHSALRRAASVGYGTGWSACDAPWVVARVAPASAAPRLLPRGADDRSATVARRVSAARRA